MNAFQSICAALICAASLHVAHATTVIGVTGSSGDGNFANSSFYEIDTDTGVATFRGEASVTPNQLAYDVTTGNYYYMDHTGSDFYRYDLTTDSEVFMGDLVASGMPAGTTGSGAGDFYDGRYYYTPESGSEGIFVVSFNSDGSQITSHTPIAPGNLSDFSDLFDGSRTAGLGDFGDVAINAATGQMYGSSTMRQNGSNYTAFWSIDLTDSDYTMTMISTSLTNVYQLAFDEDNQLWANRWANGAGQQRGELYRLDLSDGSILETRLLTVNGSPANGDFFDLASTNVREGVDIIPEPSSISILGIAALLSLLYRRRG